MVSSIDAKIFRLPNGELIETEKLEAELKKICHYVEYVTLAIKDNEYLIAIIFPNKSLFSNPDYEKSPEEGCYCPRNLEELGKCLFGCMHSINNKLLPGFAKINSAVIINTELSIADGTLTPSLNILPENVVNKYRPHLNNLFGGKAVVKEKVFNMKFS